MAEASVAVGPDRFRCPVCLDLMKDPVTTPCGHSFCKVCIKGCWDLEDQRGVYSCPRCRGAFTQRPAPQRNSMLADLMETLKWVEPVKKPELQAEFQKLDRTKGLGGSHRQGQLEEVRTTFQQMIQDKEKKLEEQKRAVNTLKCSAQAAVEDAERIFAELIHSIEEKRSEVTELIRVQENAELSRAEGLLEKLEQEIGDLRRIRIELDEVPHAEDDLQLLQSFRALCVTSASQDPGPSITVSHLSSEDLRKSLSDLKERLEEFCEEEFSNIPSPVAAEPRTLPSEPKTREDFLQYYRKLTLDPNTVNHELRLCEKNREVRWRGIVQRDPDHPERFDFKPQVLCKEGVCGRCYWEVEWHAEEDESVSVSVSYKGISRKGWGNESSFIS